MKKLLCLVVIYATFLAPLTALAEKCTVPIALVNPCEGVLLPTEAASEGLECLQVNLPTIQLLLDKERELFNNYRLFSESLLKIETEHSSKLVLALEEIVKVKAPEPFWKSPYLWVGVGFVLGAGTAIAATYASR